MRSNSRRIALGGMLAAVACVIMLLGGWIPVTTYVCPMLCCVTEFTVLRFCGRRIAWTWYVAVCILSLLLGPDKEAAMVFTAVGCYPILKPEIERCRASNFLKLLYFNAAILLAYLILIRLLGMEELTSETTEFGLIGLAAILLLGNVAFLLLDRLLTIMGRKLR